MHEQGPGRPRILWFRRKAPSQEGSSSVNARPNPPEQPETQAGHQQTPSGSLLAQGRRGESSRGQIENERPPKTSRNALYEAGELVVQAEGLLEDTAEASSEGGIVLLQKGIELGDKHIKGFLPARRKIGARLENLHESYIEHRAESMVNHPSRLFNRLALRTMLRQTVRESLVTPYEQWQADHPQLSKLARSPLTVAEIVSLLPLWIPLPLRNQLLPIPLFLNQMSTLVAVNGRKALVGLAKRRPMEFAIYGAFSVLDFVLPMFNAYPIAPAIDAFVANHYHKARRTYIKKVAKRLAENNEQAAELRTFLEPKLMRAKKSAKIYRPAASLPELQVLLARQRNELFARRPKKPVIEDESFLHRSKQQIAKIPIISIPVHAWDLLLGVRHHLDILRWKGKMDSVEELNLLTQLFLPEKPS